MKFVKEERIEKELGHTHCFSLLSMLKLLKAKTFWESIDVAWSEMFPNPFEFHVKHVFPAEPEITGDSK